MVFLRSDAQLICGKLLNEAGFTATTEFKDEPKPGDIMLAGNGGSVLFYVIGHNATVTRRLVEFLQQSDYAGVIFTKQAMEGTFALEQANIQNANAPDVVMAFRWDKAKNQFGIPGMIDADWQRAAGKGTHATLSRFDMHNTLIAAGPDFKRDQTDDLASGNVDLAPTILQILGIKPPQNDRRQNFVRIHERPQGMAVFSPPHRPPSRKPETKTIEATKNFRSGTWRQSLQISRVGSTVYLDQGNGAFVANQTAPVSPARRNVRLRRAVRAAWYIVDRKFLIRCLRPLDARGYLARDRSFTV